MRSGGLRPVLVAAGVGALMTLAAVAAAGGPLLSTRPARWRPHLVSPHAAPTAASAHSRPGTGGPLSNVPPPPTHPLAHWVVVVLTVATVVAVAVALALLAAWLLTSPVWRSLVPSMHPPAPAPTTAPVRDDDRDRVATQIRDALADLDEAHDPRAAVIASWRRLELAAADAGVERAPSETAGELTRRVLSSLSVRTEPLAALNAVYLRARFSPAAVTENDRDTARAALLAVQQDLAVPGAAMGRA